MCNEASVRRNIEKPNELSVQVRKPLPLSFCSGNKVVSEFYGGYPLDYRHSWYGE
ncbi:hypothetical protein Hanom_Chr07g00595851 [Helianthus anomalus]